MTIKPEFKTFASKQYKRIKFIYLLLVHTLLLIYSPYLEINHESDTEGQVINFELKIPFTKYKYNKSIVWLN